MEKQVSVHIILNPTAGAGKAGRLLPELRTLLDRQFAGGYVVHLTQAPFDGVRLARQAARTGATLVVAAGGDGTIQEVVNGLYENRKPLRPDLRMGLVNFGTGHGFAQSLNLPAALSEQVELLKNGSETAVDVGLVRYRDDRKTERERLFVNECQAGIGGDVVARVGDKHKFFGGKVAFGLAAVREALFGRSYPIRIKIDRENSVLTDLIGLAAGNGARMGGGMRLTPDAQPNDGLLDILLMRRMNPLQKLVNFTRIYSGRHLRSKFFSLQQGREIRLDSPERVRIEADGELLGWLPADIALLPDPLKVKTNSLKP